MNDYNSTYYLKYNTPSGTSQHWRYYNELGANKYEYGRKNYLSGKIQSLKCSYQAVKGTTFCAILH